MNQLLFQGSEKTLHGGIIPAVGPPAHAAGDAALGQLLGQAWRAIAFLDLAVDGPDFHQEGIAALLPGACGTLLPGVEAGAGNAEGVAEDGHGPVLLVSLDEGEDHSASLAKKAVAFFKMSRSICRRLFSARSWRSSSSMVERLPWPGKACSPPCSRVCFQERSRVSPTSRERAASATE